ncbi:MAG: tRNA 4-thiouridine(8) synthase ThiI [Candidatus Omnitrophica bacterium]|nr:tRNA 4-thiouridine(8) synthase ThiI [Candidatus Omnitrophota bacterium]
MKAIALISGGLDSILAARLIQEQGVDIIPLNFKIPFCHRDNHFAKKTEISSFVVKSLGKDLKTVDITNAFLKLLSKPKHGFGSNMNPCIDCKILMLTKAKELMGPWEAKFIVTGEVLGQRPMSQHKQALEAIEKESGLEGLLLRPLCARLLPQTIPEKEDWVKLEKLLDFNGRSRRPQMILAEKFKIIDYPNPAGGCLLTDREFSKRLKDLITHKAVSIGNIELLKMGRHFRISLDTKLIVGREERENKEIEGKAREGDYLFMPNDNLAGATALGRGSFNRELIKLSSQITCRYCDLNGAKSEDIIIKKVGCENPSSQLNVSPLEEGKLAVLRV